MLIVHRCWLYPVKGFPGVPVPALTLAPGGSAAGDRAFIFAFASAQTDARGWVDKHQGLTLLNTPRLASLRAAYDPAARRLQITAADGAAAAARVDAAEEREALSAWVAARVLAWPENPLSARPERLPLRLLGDGAARFTDRGPTQVTLLNAASVADLAARTGRAVDGRRFRANLVVEGAAAWAEHAWSGRVLTAGSVRLRVTKALGRCRAIDADPDGGGRDASLLSALERLTGAQECGVQAEVLGGGRLSAGDTLSLESADAGLPMDPASAG